MGTQAITSVTKVKILISDRMQPRESSGKPKRVYNHNMQQFNLLNALFWGSSMEVCPQTFFGFPGWICNTKAVHITSVMHTMMQMHAVLVVHTEKPCGKLQIVAEHIARVE